MRNSIKKNFSESESKDSPSNLDNVLKRFEPQFQQAYLDRIPMIKNFVKNFIEKSNYNVKFLNACTTYLGVRTRDQIIICAPSQMSSLGDFLYTLFHEIRHEQQISDIKMPNPLSDFDLEDFEKIYEQYWEMELDADQYAKNMLGRLVFSLKMPIEDVKKIFRLSQFIEQYPQASKIVGTSLERIIETIKYMKSKGMDYSDIQDHPMVKPFIEKLEKFL
jgi:hypothetical protein